MRFVFISEPTFELWDYSNPDTKGIGGSETSHIEMARRLAALGHDVVSYAPTPFLGPDVSQGVTWYRFDQLDYSQRADVWVIYRAPDILDNLPEGQNIWLICQDVDYKRLGHELNEERARKLTRLVALCETHGQYLRYSHPYAKDKVCVSSNGIKRELIERIVSELPTCRIPERHETDTVATAWAMMAEVRHPHRMMYASSPDRGMEYLLMIFPRIKELVPDAELHLFYGFNNIDKVIEAWGIHSRVAMNTAKLQGMLEQPGVVWHGRTPQPELLREWAKSAIWCHPSNFTETSCITCMDAQALGAIPVTSPVWAVAENVKHGVFIHGNVTQEIIRARYVLEVFRLMVDEERQEEIRREMMPWAIEQFDWNKFARQWQDWAAVDGTSETLRLIRSLEEVPA